MRHLKFGLNFRLWLASSLLTASAVMAAPLDITGPYLGQKPPGMVPETFAPGIVSTKKWEVNGVFSPDLQSYYHINEVEVDGQLKQQFVVYQQRHNKWHLEVLSPRIGQPFISPDGQTMHLGKRFKQRTTDGWSELQSLGAEFEQFRIMSLTSSANGTLVFDEMTPGTNILRISQRVDGVQHPPVALPPEINTGQYNVHPFIAPDESYIIWDGQRNSSVRNANLFISFKRDDDTWSEAIEFGPDINTSAGEFGAKVTPDGKYLMFNRKVGEFRWTNPDGKIETIPDIDVFWVDAKVIEQLRPG